MAVQRHGIPLALCQHAVSGVIPRKGQTIDSALIRQGAVGTGILAGLSGECSRSLADVLWAATMLFFLTPLITLAASTGERSLLLPSRATYRMAAALLVPLVVLGRRPACGGVRAGVAAGRAGGDVVLVHQRARAGGVDGDHGADFRTGAGAAFRQD